MFWFNSNTVYSKSEDNTYKILKYYSVLSGDETRFFSSDHVSSVLKTNKYKFLGCKTEYNYMTPGDYDKKINELKKQILYIAFVDGEVVEIDSVVYDKLLNMGNSKRIK